MEGREGREEGREGREEGREGREEGRKEREEGREGREERMGEVMHTCTTYVAQKDRVTNGVASGRYTLT